MCLRSARAGLASSDFQRLRQLPPDAALARLKGDWQFADAEDDEAAKRAQRRVWHAVESVQTTQQRSKSNARLQTSEWRSQAEVDAMAEGEMPQRRRANPASPVRS